MILTQIETKHGGQTRKVWGHMKSRGKITTVEAFGLYGITRLSAKIFDLRKEFGDIAIISKRKPGVHGSYVEYSINVEHFVHAA